MRIGNIITRPVLCAFVELGTSDGVDFVNIRVYNPSLSMGLGIDLIDRRNSIDRIVPTRERARCVGGLTVNERLGLEKTGLRCI